VRDRPLEGKKPAPSGARLSSEGELRATFLGTAGLSLTTVAFLDNPDPERLLRAAGGNDRDLALTLADRPFDHLKQILQILLPAETALLGSAMGFYYGSQTKGAG